MSPVFGTDGTASEETSRRGSYESSKYLSILDGRAVGGSGGGETDGERTDVEDDGSPRFRRGGGEGCGGGNGGDDDGREAKQLVRPISFSFPLAVRRTPIG